MRRNTVLFAALLLQGCQPAVVSPKPEPFAVAAPFEKTWNAVIDIFAERNISIATIDKGSGLIVARTMSVSGSDGAAWASCRAGLIRPSANRATFNILVRPSTGGSTVNPTATWEYLSGSDVNPCNSTYVWERSIAMRIKATAEGK